MKIPAAPRIAELGDPASQFRVARRYDEGEGVDKDHALEAAWYQAAAEQGHAMAQYNLGWMCFCGDGRERELPLGQAVAPDGGGPGCRQCAVGTRPVVPRPAWVQRTSS